VNSLARRIISLPRRTPDLTPAGRGSLPGPVSFPSHTMVISPGNGAGIVPNAPLITSDGAAIPARGPGGWDQLAAAGRR
jgi:hypothetical protein